jgi:hypothetical protein
MTLVRQLLSFSKTLINTMEDIYRYLLFFLISSSLIFIITIPFFPFFFPFFSSDLYVQILGQTISEAGVLKEITFLNLFLILKLLSRNLVYLIQLLVGFFFFLAFLSFLSSSYFFIFFIFYLLFSFHLSSFLSLNVFSQVSFHFLRHSKQEEATTHLPCLRKLLAEKPLMLMLGLNLMLVLSNEQCK